MVKTNKISGLEYSCIYFMISTLSIGLLGLITGIFSVSKELDYSNNKIFLLGIIGIISLSVWGLSTIMVFKKFQESIKE